MPPPRALPRLCRGTFSVRFPEASSRARGGILADAMGLGKTVEALALIASVREDTASYERREHQNQLPPKTQHTQHTRTTNLEMHPVHCF